MARPKSIGQRKRSLTKNPHGLDIFTILLRLTLVGSVLLPSPVLAYLLLPPQKPNLMKSPLSLKVLVAALLVAGSTSLIGETMVLNTDDGNGRILKITSPDDLNLDPDSVVVAIDAFGDEDREVNGVLFQTDKTDDNSVGMVERDGVTVDILAANFIDGWAAAPAFTGGEGASADNLGQIMSDIRWMGAPGPVTMDVSGLDAGGLYELQILVNEGGDRDRHWDIGVNDVQVVDDFTSEGTNEGENVYAPDNSFAYVGEFEANADGELNVVMQQHIGGQDPLGSDNNPILQAFIVHALNTSDDDPNVLAGSTIKFGQVASTPATVKQVRLRNTGPTNELVISNIEFSGQDMANFTVLNEFPITIPPNTGVDGDPESSALIELSFDPAGRTGAFTALMEISSNDQTEAVNVIDVSASVINLLGPASHLPLDEAAGATEVSDVSGNNVHGVLLTQEGTVELGQSPGLADGTGLRVAGGGELVIEGGSLDALEDFSISLWLQVDSFGENPGTVLARGNADTPVFAILAIGSSLAWLPADGGEDPEFLARDVLTEGQAHHVVIVYVDTAGARKATIYVDGVATEQENAIAVNDESGLALQFGSYNGGLLLDTIFDDVQVYTRAISAEEVTQLRDNPGASLPIGENAPIDSDGDGLVDSREGEAGTDALDTDTDDDGLDDFAEVDTHLTDPLKPDTDDDGSGDQAEILFGTDPLDPESKLGTFAVRHVSANGLQYTNLDAFMEGLEDQSRIAEEVVGNFQVINFRDNSEGNFPQGNVPFPLWDAFGARDDFGVYAFGKIRITEAGLRTFGVNSDDGFELRINGEVVAEFPEPRGSSDTFGAIDLAEGEHDLELWFYERGGGAQLELFVNTELGEVDVFEDGNFVLLPAFGEASADVDNDSLSDFWENGFFGNLDETAEGDPDGDTLTNSAEQDARTDPTMADSDGDSVNDAEELAGDPATDPLDADTDNDGLDDGAEKTAGTNPTMRDTDGDKFSDGFEVTEGSDPLDPNSPGVQQGGPIPTRIDVGKLTSVDDLFIEGVFTHAVNVAETDEDVQVGDITFLRDDPAPDNYEIAAVNHIEDWLAPNDFGEGNDNVNLAKVASGIRWSPQPEGVVVTLKDVDRGAYRLQMIFGEKCCDRGFVVKVNDEIILDAFSPNEFQEGDYSGASAAFLIYEFNQSAAGDLVIDLNGTDAGFPDGNAILSGVSLQFIQSIDGDDSDENVVAQWSFDGNLDDVSAGVSDDHLTPTGDAEYATGVVGQAVRLTADGLQRLRAEDSDDLDLAADWTLEAYVWPDADNTGEWDRFWTKWGDGGNQWHSSFRSTGAVDVENGLDLFINDGDNIINSNTTAEVPLEQWSHVAFVGDSASGMITAWLNGEQVGETDYQEVTPGDGAMNFGNFESPANALQYTGLIDEAKIHNAAVDQAYLIRRTALIDDGGGVVTPPADSPVIAIISGPNAVGLSFSGVAGKIYDIQYSTDLITWQNIELGLQGEINYEDTNAARRDLGEGYYRAIEQ